LITQNARVISGTFAATGSDRKRRPWLAIVSATSGGWCNGEVRAPGLSRLP
jgi:hypothetical protein